MEEKVKGIIHWVSVTKCIDAEIRLYDRLFKVINPLDGEDFEKNINPDSCKVMKNAKLERSLKKAKNIAYQFERNGYFKLDRKKSKDSHQVFNRSVSLRDSWAKILAKKIK